MWQKKSNWTPQITFYPAWCSMFHMTHTHIHTQAHTVLVHGNLQRQTKNTKTRGYRIFTVCLFHFVLCFFIKTYFQRRKKTHSIQWFSVRMFTMFIQFKSHDWAIHSKICNSIKQPNREEKQCHVIGSFIIKIIVPHVMCASDLLERRVTTIFAQIGQERKKRNAVNIECFDTNSAIFERH